MKKGGFEGFAKDFLANHVFDEKSQAYVRRKESVSEKIDKFKALENKPEKPEAVEGKYFGGIGHDAIMERYNGSNPALGLFIPYHVPSSKNSLKLFVKKTKDGRAIPGKADSDDVAEYKKVSSSYYENLRMVFIKMVGNKKFPLRVQFTPIRRDEREFDYTNINQIVQDLMQEYNWIPNDSNRYLIPNFDAGYGIDKFNPGIIIKVL